MGAQAYREVVGKAKVSGDGGANAQVKRVAERIIAVSDKPNLPWEVKVIDENQANAFALPGGKIAVYTGMLPITRDDAGLAAVIGHEVGHVLARHSAERVSQQMVAQGLGGALAAGLGTDPALGQQVAGLFAQGLALPWGRKQESEADYIGLILMAKAGYDPRAARDLWVRARPRRAARGRRSFCRRTRRRRRGCDRSRSGCRRRTTGPARADKGHRGRRSTAHGPTLPMGKANDAVPRIDIAAAHRGAASPRHPGGVPGDVWDGADDRAATGLDPRGPPWWCGRPWPSLRRCRMRSISATRCSLASWPAPSLLPALSRSAAGLLRGGLCPGECCGCGALRADRDGRVCAVCRRGRGGRLRADGDCPSPQAALAGSAGGPARGGVRRV